MKFTPNFESPKASLLMRILFNTSFCDLVLLNDDEA